MGAEQPIVGGEKVTGPSSVGALTTGSEKRRLCTGGVFEENNWVITNAHCFFGKDEESRAIKLTRFSVLDSVYGGKEGDCFPINNFVVSPDFDHEPGILDANDKQKKSHGAV